MDSKVKTTVDSIKDLSGELSAWEVRLLALKNESEQLKRRNDQIKKELESALSVGQAELDRKRTAAKDAEAAVAELRAKLETDKNEFQAMLVAFRKEKNEYEKEKTKIMDAQADTTKLRDRLYNFIRLFKDEANKL